MSLYMAMVLGDDDEEDTMSEYPRPDEQPDGRFSPEDRAAFARERRIRISPEEAETLRAELGRRNEDRLRRAMRERDAERANARLAERDERMREETLVDMVSAGILTPERFDELRRQLRDAALLRPVAARDRDGRDIEALSTRAMNLRISDELRAQLAAQMRGVVEAYARQAMTTPPVPTPDPALATVRTRRAMRFAR